MHTIMSMHNNMLPKALITSEPRERKQYSAGSCNQAVTIKEIDNFNSKLYMASVDHDLFMYIYIDTSKNSPVGHDLYILPLHWVLSFVGHAEETGRTLQI